MRMRIDTDIPPPPTISAVVRGLKPKQSVLLEADAKSVRTVVSRLRLEFGRKRSFKTAVENGGVRVWRTV